MYFAFVTYNYTFVRNKQTKSCKYNSCLSLNLMEIKFSQIFTKNILNSDLTSSEAIILTGEPKTCNNIFLR